MNDKDISGEDREESDRVLKGGVSTVISIAEYACCKFCKSKVASEAALKRQGVEEEERQAVDESTQSDSESLSEDSSR